MTQNNVKIAITGGIGSGKSAVSEIIASEGYKVVSCDKVYEQLLRDKNFLDTLAENFGGVLSEDGKLNKKKLADIVFNDREKLEKLNAITHPLIMNEALRQMSGPGLEFCEVPLLFECGFEKYFDAVIVVLRGVRQRINAVALRDGVSEEEVKKRIKSQFDYENADFGDYYVLHNTSDLSDLRTKTLEIIDKLKKQ